MNNIYEIHNWSAVSQIINERDPDLKVKYFTDRSGVSGIIVYKNDETIFKVNIESPGVWGLTNSEAVELLNCYGFSCVYVEDKLIIPNNVLTILQSLKVRGLQYVIREVKPGVVYAYKTGNSPIILSDYENYTYNDWKFLPVSVETSVDKILKEYSE